MWSARLGQIVDVPVTRYDFRAVLSRGTTRPGRAANPLFWIVNINCCAPPLHSHLDMLNICDGGSRPRRAERYVSQGRHGEMHSGFTAGSRQWTSVSATIAPWTDRHAV